jgi:hypothetical protein
MVAHDQGLGRSFQAAGASRALRPGPFAGGFHRHSSPCRPSAPSSRGTRRARRNRPASAAREVFFEGSPWRAAPLRSRRPRRGGAVSPAPPLSPRGGASNRRPSLHGRGVALSGSGGAGVRAAPWSGLEAPEPRILTFREMRAPLSGQPAMTEEPVSLPKGEMRVYGSITLESDIVASLLEEAWER